jgi:hypothetical protein
MKSLIIAISVLASALAAPATAGPSPVSGAKLPAGENSRYHAAADAYALPGMTDGDLQKCRAYLAGEDGVYPFACVVGTHTNGSEGGSDGQ